MQVTAILAICSFILAFQTVRQTHVSFGRLASDDPSPRCCISADCTASNLHRHAFVTSLRSRKYAVLLRELKCSLELTNPGVPLVVLAVAGELDADLIAEITSYATYTEVPNVEFANTRQPRFSKNWFKLNAWNLTEFSSLILMDSDLVVRGNITHLFHLPTDFAWAQYNAPNYDWNRGGFIMLRPCASVFQHMMEILHRDASKHFERGHAEQDFLSWYFQNTGYRLPMIYNANRAKLDINGTTAGGAMPLVVHFADNKPFNITAAHPDWSYMCHRSRSSHT